MLRELNEFVISYSVLLCSWHTRTYVDTHAHVARTHTHVLIRERHYHSKLHTQRKRAQR